VAELTGSIVFREKATRLRWKGGGGHRVEKENELISTHKKGTSRGNVGGRGGKNAR